MAKCNCSGKSCECKKSVNEHLSRIKFVSNYTLNEAKYSLVQDMDEDDGIPEEIWSSKPISEDGEPTGDAVSKDATKPEETPEMPEDQIAAGQEPTQEIPTEPAVGAIPTDPTTEPSPMEPQKDANELQNEIIKSSVVAMQKMHQEMDRLNMTVDSLNAKMGDLNKDVEEVREPTNVEKLMSKKEDSHPFYYNLNDMWDNNWFQARRMEDKSNGITQLEDGSYVADFDSLPKYNDRELKDSFNI